MLTSKDLLASVGYFLFRWSSLEQELSKAILDGEGVQFNDNRLVKGSFEDRLRRWYKLKSKDTNAALLDDIVNQAETLRQFRNLIVHGLANANSAPHDGSEPHILCVVGGWENPTGESRKISYAELNHYAEAADACCRAFNFHPEVFNYRL